MPSTNISCVICDDVRQEKSGKNTLVGVYNDAIVFLKSEWEKNKSKIGLSQLYFANFVSNAPEGPLKISWWIEDRDGNLVVMKKKGEAEIVVEDRTQAVLVRIVPIVFDKLGEHRFVIEAGDFRFEKPFDVRVADKLPG